jgi:hypothetical protein
MKTTPDLNKMWAELARYQPYANKDGHGESWRTMCSERTREATWAARAAAMAAWDAAWAARAAAWAASAYAASAGAGANAPVYWSALAIERIEAAIKERNHD